MNILSKFNLTSRIVFLVSLLGALAVIITLYSLASLRAVDRDYRALLNQDARASLLISAALLDLSDASHLVLSVLTEQEVADMRQTQQQLAVVMEDFDDKLATIAPLVSNASHQLSLIRQQERALFEQANAVIDSAARWRGDRALTIIHQEFDPTLQSIRQNMDVLRSRTVNNFNSTSEALSATTRATMVNTAAAFTLALILVIGLSAYISLTQISRPIKQLTRTMNRLSLRDYACPIDHTERQDEVGSMAKALEVFRDNMQRADRLEREALIDAENRRISQQLIDLTEAMPGAVFQLRVNPDGEQRFQFLSGKASRYIGDSAFDASHSGLRLDRIRVDKSPEHTRALERLISQSLNQLCPLDMEMEVETETQRFWLKTLASARKTSDGAILLNGIWLDTSEAKAQAQALETAKEQAEQAAKAKSDFLATMSHEIRTPMNAILGFAELVLKHPLEQRQREHMEKLVRSGQHLLGIINDILDFSKIDGKHLTVERIPFSPQQLLDDTREMLGDKARDKGLQLEFEPASALPNLVGDPLRIYQILLNYTNNAIKFSEHGTITLRLELQQVAGNGTCLYGEVEDQGIGLSKQEQAKLFAPFQQADTSITRRYGGTGLGLAISRSLSELMDGDVGVRSTLGKGSCFWFRVRVGIAAPDTPLTISSPTPPQADPGLNGLRVLLVDDNEVNRLVAREFLHEAGVLVDEVEDGYDAVQQLTQNSQLNYDAVLMDVMMPGLDGLSATRILRQNTRLYKLPIIAMSANASQEDEKKSLQAGMNVHLPKPIDQHLLWRTLSRLCLGNVTDIPSPRAPAPEAEDSASVLDPLPLETLKQLVSTERFISMLAMLTADCIKRGERFRALGDAADPQTLSREAHDLISTAGHSGLRKLEQSARTLKSELENAPDETVLKKLCMTIYQNAMTSVATLETYFGVRS